MEHVILGRQYFTENIHKIINECFVFLKGRISYPETLVCEIGTHFNVDLSMVIRIRWIFFCFDTLRPRKMDAIFQTTFSSGFSSMKMYAFLLKFHWSLFPGVQLTIFHHWFRKWLGADQATSHYLNQWWLVYWRIYASRGLNELNLIWSYPYKKLRFVVHQWHLQCGPFPSHKMLCIPSNVFSQIIESSHPHPRCRCHQCRYLLNFV